jgi:Na+/proline symporter
MTTPPVTITLTPRAIVLALSLLNLPALAAAVVAGLYQRRVEQLVDEMLAGRQLPIGTTLVMAVEPWLWLLPVGLIGAACALLIPGRFPRRTAGVLTFLTLLAAAVLPILHRQAATLPLIAFIDSLG